MAKMKILLDNGHSNNSDTNHSPDGRLIEGRFAREVTRGIAAALKAKGYDVERIVPEDSDISLSIRSKRVNEICDKLGSKNVILISIHLDACDSKVDSGGWTKANHWSAWVYRGASEQARTLAKFLYYSAKEHGIKVCSDVYRTAGFWIVRKTKCPAVLTENLFQNNRENCAWLLTPEGKQTIIDLHVDGIIKYLKSVGE